jgi:hypothetical protein
MIQAPGANVTKLYLVNHSGNLNLTFSRVKITRKIATVFMFATMSQFYKTFYRRNLLPFHCNYQGNIDF